MTNDDRAREAVEHLQKAALEMIAAMRAVLDVAEDLVNDPAPVMAMVAAAATQGRKITDAAKPARRAERAAGVEHIAVS